MGSSIRVPVQEYHKFDVFGSRELTPETSGGSSLADVQALVLTGTVKPWTIDHLNLSYDTETYGDTADAASIQFLKVPATVKIDTYLVSGSSSVVALTDEMLISDMTPLTLNDIFALDEAANDTMKTEAERRFAAGDRLVCLLRNFSRTGALGPGSGIAASGADTDIGFENAVASWLGRTVQL